MVRFQNSKASELPGKQNISASASQPVEFTER